VTLRPRVLCGLELRQAVYAMRLRFDAILLRRITMITTLSRHRAPATTRTMVGVSIESSSPVCGERYLHACQTRTNRPSAPLPRNKLLQPSFIVITNRYKHSRSIPATPG